MDELESSHVSDDTLTFRERFYRLWKRFPHPIRMLAVLLVGLTLVIVGVILLVLPGPGLLLIALGVAVLASEFAWAASILHHGKRVGNGVLNKVRKAKPQGSEQEKHVEE